MRKAFRECSRAAGRRNPKLTLWEAIDPIYRTGCKHVLCTDVERDGALQGPTVALYAEAREALSADRLAGFRRRALGGRPGRARGHRSRRRDQRQGIARRTIQPAGVRRHSCQTHHPLPRRPRRPGRQRACASAITRSWATSWSSPSATATKAPTRSCSTTSPRARKAAASIATGSARVARILDIPFCVAGGIRSRGRRRGRAAMRARTRSPSTHRPSPIPDSIDELASRFGSQCVVIGIDSARSREGYRVFQFTGDPNRSRNTGRDTLVVGARGAGARRRRDRAQLHDQRWRAPRLRRHATRGRARGVRRAAGGLRRCRCARAFRRRIREGTASMPRSRPACFTPAPSRFPISRPRWRRPASRCGYEHRVRYRQRRFRQRRRTRTRDRAGRGYGRRADARRT